MDLSYGPEYEAFRAGLRAFLTAHRERAPKAGAGVAAGRPGPALREWQALLIEHGYAARTIPREYGGAGAEPDILKRVIIDEELNAAGVSRGIGGQQQAVQDPGVAVAEVMRELGHLRLVGIGDNQGGAAR